jgi:hypothetical protein
MSIMRTKGQGYVVVNPNPKSGGWASAMGWAAKYYQQNQTQKNPNFDTIGKLMIQNYAKDLGSGVFYGWDVISADERRKFVQKCRFLFGNFSEDIAHVIGQ